MLQWMGGSRRKVTTSRKSTQKRQKQYFEQRRRQQQHQPGADNDGKLFEGNKTYPQQNENNRSLDILSLLNLSSVAQEQKSSCPIATETSDDDALDYQTLQHLPVVQSNEVKTQEHSKIKEARTSSSHQKGNAFPKTISLGASGSHAETLKTDGEKMYQLKMAPDSQLSVIDLLGDDEPISGSEKRSAHESHVAFSIEGLGKVEIETPVHSPDAHSRSFLHGCSSPLKATKIANSYKDLMSEMVNPECELDAMMWDSDLPFCRSPVEQPFCSKKIVDSFCKPKTKLAFEEFSPFDDSNNSLRNLPGEDELFYGSEDRNDSIWNGSCIRADNILDVSGFHLSDKIWMDPTYKSTDFSKSVDCRKKLFAFEGLDQQERRSTMRKAGKLHMTESPAPHFKCQKLNNLSDFTLPDEAWHSSIGRDYDFRDLKDEVRESCFMTEDARESLSLPSEESSSSTAVRSKLERTFLNLKNKQAMTDGDDIFCSESVYSEMNTSPSETNRDKWNTSLKGKVDEPRKFTRMSNSSRSVQVPQFHTTPKKRSKPDCRYFEAEYDLEEQSSGCNSFSETSGTKKHVSLGCGLWDEDLFHATEDAKLGSSKSSVQRFSKSSAKCSPCCKFTKETHDICKPNWQNLSRSSIQDIFQSCNIGRVSHKPLDVHGCSTPKKESIARHADEGSGTQVSDHGKFQPQGDEFSGSQSLSSENGNSIYASDSEVEHRDRKEPSRETPNMGENENKTICFQQAENLPSLETTNRIDGKQWNANGKCQFAQAFPLGQTGSGEAEDPRPKQGTMGLDVQGTTDSTCQVMSLIAVSYNFFAFRCRRKYLLR